MGTNEGVTVADMEDRAFRYFTIAVVSLAMLSAVCGIACTTLVQVSIASFHLHLLVTFAAYPFMWAVWWIWMEAVLYFGDAFLDKPMSKTTKELRAYASGWLVRPVFITVIIAAAMLFTKVCMMPTKRIRTSSTGYYLACSSGLSSRSWYVWRRMSRISSRSIDGNLPNKTQTPAPSWLSIASLPVTGRYSILCAQLKTG